MLIVAYKSIWSPASSLHINEDRSFERIILIVQINLGKHISITYDMIITKYNVFRHIII